MALVWDDWESQLFQARLKANIAVWSKGLVALEYQVAELSTVIGEGPSAKLSGAAWNTAKTLFQERILPIVQVGRSVCDSLSAQLEQYAAYESPLQEHGVHLEEASLVATVDSLTDEIKYMTYGSGEPLSAEGEEEIASLTYTVSKVKDRLQDLRTFSTNVSGLFNESVTIAIALAKAVQSIAAGSLSDNGTFVPTEWDDESWQQAIVDFWMVHPPSLPGTADPAVVALLTEKIAGAGSQLTPIQINLAAAEIAQIVSEAPEPYKTLFLTYLPKVRFVDTDNPDWQRSPLSLAHIDFDNMTKDVPAHYHTFFHEFGHAVDYLTGVEGHVKESETHMTYWYYYESADGTSRTLTDWMKSDAYAGVVYTLTNRPLNGGNYTTADQATRIAQAAVYSGPGSLDGWNVGGTQNPTPFATPGSDAAVYQALQAYIASQEGLGNDVSRTASDVMGAATTNGLRGTWCHYKWYWSIPYDLSPKEFWAGFFADSMTQSYQLNHPPTSSDYGKTSLEVTKTLFPQASEAAAAMALDMLGR